MATNLIPPFASRTSWVASVILAVEPVVVSLGAASDDDKRKGLWPKELKYVVNASVTGERRPIKANTRFSMDWEDGVACGCGLDGRDGM